MRISASDWEKYASLVATGESVMHHKLFIIFSPQFLLYKDFLSCACCSRPVHWALTSLCFNKSILICQTWSPRQHCFKSDHFITLCTPLWTCKQTAVFKIGKVPLRGLVCVSAQKHVGSFWVKVLVKITIHSLALKYCGGGLLLLFSHLECWNQINIQPGLWW